MYVVCTNIGTFPSTYFQPVLCHVTIFFLLHLGHFKYALSLHRMKDLGIELLDLKFLEKQAVLAWLSADALCLPQSILTIKTKSVIKWWCQCLSHVSWHQMSNFLCMDVQQTLHSFMVFMECNRVLQLYMQLFILRQKLHRWWQKTFF